MKEVINSNSKKPILHKLDLETYLANIQDKADKISDKFVIMFFVLGLFLAPVYGTWLFTIANSVIIAGLYLTARFVLTNKFMARMIISVVYAIFMLQFIGQMHGMAEVHFFFFLNIALLIIYQDWRIMIPYTVFAIGHHSLLAILQANAANIDFLQGVNLGNYFIGYGGRTIEGETVDYITTFQLFFHFGLASMMAFICGWWAMLFRQNSVELMEKQIEQQAQNEELSASEEELRQNAEELQSTNDRMKLIQIEIEEKQTLLNRAEKLVGLASYEIDLASQRLKHSDNLPLIYGEKKIDDIQKIIEIAHPKDAYIVVDTITQASKGEMQEYDISYRSKGSNHDEYKHYRAMGRLIKDAMNNPEKLVGTVQDITNEVKQKQALEEAYRKVQSSEEELRQNYEELQATQEELHFQKQRLEQIFDGVPAMIYQFKMTPEGHLSFPVVSRGSELVYGLPAQTIMDDASSILACIHPDDLEHFQNSVGESAQTMTNWKADLRTIIDGKMLWVRGSSKPVKDNEGNIIWSGIVQEVTEQKNIEKELQRLSLVASKTDNAVIITDQNSITEWVNTSFTKVTEYSFEEAMNKKPGALLQGEATSKEHIEKIREGLASQKPFIQEIYNYTKSGKGFWVELNITPIFNEKKELVNFIAIQSDITARKETQLEIQNKNEELQASQEELKQNLEKLQATQELLENQNQNIESAFNELQNTQNQLIQSEKMASLGQLIANIAHEINTPLGAIRSSSVSIALVLEKILPSLPSLLKKLDDNTLSHFNEFIIKASQKSDTLSSREKREIKYNLIEELEAIDIKEADQYADWIVDMNMYQHKDLYYPFLAATNSKEIFYIAYQLSTIIRSNQTVKIATDRAAKIVFALKNYAHQDQRDEKTIVDINESIETTLTLYHNQIKHGIDVTTEWGEIPKFMGYPDELIQVWTNIVHNAIQAMKNKGNLFIQTRVENNHVLVSIQDNGGGIHQDIQNRIFDAFFTTKSAGEGSGLGLDITKKIIEKHDGKIWFETEEGIGTTFFIELPII